MPATDYVVVLYGSHARGDSDDLSDTDVMVISPSFNDDLPAVIPPAASVVRYIWSEFVAIGQYGSPFLLHLRTEGAIIDGDDEGKAKYLRIVSHLPGYSRVQHDINAFKAAIEDSMVALDMGDTSVVFELSSIATVFRHASILGCYAIGNPTYGRYKSVQNFCNATKLPPSFVDEFPDLYKFRIAAFRGGALPRKRDVQYARMWCDRALRLIEEVECCVANSNLP